MHTQRSCYTARWCTWLDANPLRFAIIFKDRVEGCRIEQYPLPHGTTQRTTTSTACDDWYRVTLLSHLPGKTGDLANITHNARHYHEFWRCR